MQSVRKGRVSLVETATDEIRTRIVSGAWPVGSRTTYPQAPRSHS
ncbi:hypothetical protein [Streptomyces sp. NPDC054765]